MKTLVMEGVVTAVTQISHNGGEINGNMAMFRRMPITQPDLTTVEVPHVSGNSIRGKLRDVAAKHFLDMLGEEETPHRVPLPIFQMLFSGGSLTSGNTDGDVDKFSEIRDSVPVFSLFGTAYGNAILAGKMKVNPLIPIAKETAHIIPAQFVQGDLPSVHTYIHLGMYTRRENSQDAGLQQYIELAEADKDATTTQMIYHIESINAGTPFYWKVVLEDVTAEEFDFFLSVLEKFRQISVVGGKSAVGFGQVEIGAVTWTDITKAGNILTVESGTTPSIYTKMIGDNKGQIRGVLAGL